MRLEFQQEPPLDGPTNMARDVVLLQRAEQGQPAARVYSWSEPWVTLGCFQSPDRDLLPGSTVPYVMRPTGGKAVLHGHDLTVGLAIPLSTLNLNPRDIKAIYRAVVTPIARALQQSGLPAELGENTRFHSKGPRTADCFAFVSANDVVDQRTGRKVCGCALKVTEQAVLLQASIPSREPEVDVTEILVGGKHIQVAPWDTSEFAQNFERELRTLLEPYAVTSRG
jgi:lipoate-protein ligase A